MPILASLSGTSNLRSRSTAPSLPAPRALRKLNRGDHTAIHKLCCPEATFVASRHLPFTQSASVFHMKHRPGDFRRHTHGNAGCFT